ncbi:hypothetical protein PG994_002898 [Apiospora phragmitis]|uniref:Uncharacterized protein n=1 Tax=Apiospora phragmitis TaxID=2905665 RepID=A0ABR1W6I7_9PEZI
MSDLSSRLSKLNVFSKLTGEDDEDEHDEKINYESVAGGGHAGRRTAITTGQLRVSHALRSFLVSQNVLSGCRFFEVVDSKYVVRPLMLGISRLDELPR